MLVSKSSSTGNKKLKMFRIIRNTRTNMKKAIKNIALFGCVAVGVGFGFSSCDDYLTITPTSSIVEEEFWQDKNDLNNAVYACYKRLVSNDILHKYEYWGEMRSDNFERSTSVSATGQVANIMNANLLPTYDIFNWTPMYNVINQCNKIINHGPGVVAYDESFSNSDWTPIYAEMVTLRAFCHFNLVRTFGEIPYVTIDYNNDNQELKMPQSTQLAVLDSIVSDLESVKDKAMSDYGNNVLNHGRITKKAVYTLLADVYLWRASYKAGNNHPFVKLGFESNYIGDVKDGDVRTETFSTSAESDYEKCIECCNKVIEIVTKEKIDHMNESGQNIGGGDIKIELEDLLEQNVSTSSASYILSTSQNAYKSIFGDGNSEESIFELQVEGTTYGNGMITSLYHGLGSNPRAGSFIGVPTLLEAVNETPNNVEQLYMFSKTDYRRWESFQYNGAGQTEYWVNKYTCTRISQSAGSTSTMLTDNNSQSLKVENTPRSSSNVDANWIVYRLSEVYLMKAEAMSQLYDDLDHLQTAFSYVREVFKRSNPYAYSANNNTANKDSLDFLTFSSQEGIEKLIMAERQREFVGEGKRWFDLVRYAQRRGNSSEMLSMLTRKYSSNGKAVKAKLADMQSLFSPVYNSELKNNNLLYQNGVWYVNKSSSKTDNL